MSVWHWWTAAATVALLLTAGAAAAQPHVAPAPAQVAYEEARRLVLAGDVHRAVVRYIDALQADSDYVDALYDLAWIYSTSEDSDVRDPATAVVLAEKLVELTHYKERKSTAGSNWPKPFKIRCSHVLATAFASNGNFEWAAEYARQAFAAASKLAHDAPTPEATQLLGDSRQFVALYEARRPYHPAGQNGSAVVLPPR